MKKLIKLDPVFKKKVKVFKRYLYIIKDKCDRLDIDYKNKFADKETVEKETEKFIKNLSEKIFKTLDAHYQEMWSILVEKFNFNERNYKRNRAFRVHQEFYKRQLMNFFIGCEMVQQILYKPLGYAGDFKVMIFLYKNNSPCQNSYYRLIDIYSMNTPIAHSVRSRKDYSIINFKEVIKNKQKNILSVASGSSTEIAELIKMNLPYCLNISLLDADKSALEYAKNELSSLTNENINITYHHQNIFEMTKYTLNTGEQDLIYSLGLFDYLNDGLFIRCAKNLYDLLNDTGKLVIGNVSITNTTRAYMSLVGEWNIIHRSEEELIKIAQKCRFNNFSIEKDDTGVQLYLIVRK
ncbi:MAG TPA: hypothetical protein DF296_13755 [Candidatus Margulisbacteria bacterium]|nr:MAG: hypothetical protein A2X43_05220 [Candidatus Margulisbacteria bacterium GWD2_39_127]HAR63587.1 hypothetical protein [Candidatus Margulisiibacteriota bacterium]HCT86252.1 hypothetical protein [Candidatus Margulisiibacteriota bacterium]